MTWKHVAYIDETGAAGCYWMCAVVVHIDRIRAAQAALTAVAEKAARDYGLADPPELHGYNLFHAEGEFAGFKSMYRARIGIYEQAIDALVSAEPTIILRGVETEGLKYQSPHRIVWRYTIESLDESGCEAPIQVVADRHGMEGALRDDIASYISYGTQGWKPRIIENVLPEIKFLDSRSNPLLQAADMVAYINQRRQSVETERHPKSHLARERLWDRIQPWVRLRRVWSPP